MKYEDRRALVKDLQELLCAALDLAQVIGRIQTGPSLDEGYKVQRKGVDVEFTKELARCTTEDIQNTVQYLEEIVK